MENRQDDTADDIHINLRQKRLYIRLISVC